MTSFFPTLHALQTALDQTPRSENIPITDVHFDSRDVTPGSLYIALTNPKWDGHDHISSAIENGATTLLTEQLQTNLPTGVTQIIVANTNTAFHQLAVHIRKNYVGKVIALTGSAGKTTCKEFLKTLLSDPKNPKDLSKTAHANIGNFNNKIGAPLTLLRLPADAPCAIFELGMSTLGQIAPLSQLVKPHIAIVLNTLPVHTEGVGGLEGVTREKCSIADGLISGGTLILNSDISTKNLKNFPPPPAKNIHMVTFGQNTANYLLNCPKLTETNPVSVIIDQETYVFDLKCPTIPRQQNALVALLAAKTAGANLPNILPLLSQSQTPKGRGNIIKINNITLIDDSYNANPASVKAALTTLKNTPTNGGKRYALLGDMKELGPEEVNYHKDLAQFCTNIDGIFTCGNLMQNLATALPTHQHLHHFQNAQNLNLTHILQHLNPHDALLIKGSNSGFYAHQTVQKIADALQKKID